MFLRRLCLKTSIDFAYFGRESGMVFLRELREFMNVLIEPLLIRSCEFEIDLKKFFVFALI